MGERQSVSPSALFVPKLPDQNVDHIHKGDAQDQHKNHKHNQGGFSRDIVIDGITQDNRHQQQGGNDFGYVIHGKAPCNV